MKHIIYSILLSVGCLIMQPEATAQDNCGEGPNSNSPNCMSMGTNFWFLADWSDEAPFKDIGDWAAAHNSNADVWNTDFYEEIKIYSTYRFMDWGGTNDSEEVNWADRKQPTEDHTPPNAGEGRVAYEWMIDLCNRQGKDMWVCVPHKTTEDYWIQLATLLKNELNSNSKIYLEYSNETWNPMFTQFQYTIDKGLAHNLPGEINEQPNQWYKGGAYSVWQSIKIFKAFKDVFGNEFDSRVVTVIAANGNIDIADVAIDNIVCDPQWNPHGIVVDAFANAPYAGDGLDGSSADIVAQFEQKIQERYTQKMLPAEDIAKRHNMKFIAYEGGHHLKLNAHLWSANPAIYQKYIDMLDQYMPHFDLFCHYTHSGSWTSNNAWGAKAFTGQNIADAHKYRAIKDWINANSADSCDPGTGTNPPNNGGDCPLDLTVTGDYPASQNQAANTLECLDITIDNNENVVCNAGTLITLGDKFHAVSGSTFHAFIDECTPEPPTQGDCELLDNPSFDTSISSSDWGQWGASISVNGSIASITGITTSSGTGGAGIGQNNLTFKTGKTYTLSFKAQSNNRDVTLKVFKNGGDYKTYINETISLTNSMGYESFTFTMSDPEITNGAVQLQFGNNGAHISVDILSLVEANCGTTPPPSGGGCELVSNGTFDNTSGWSNWSCTFSSSNNEGTVTGITTGAEGTSGISFSGLEIENGKSYTLSFDARAYGDRTMKARVYTGAPSYKSYGETVNLSNGGMQPYVINFTADASSTNASVDFLLGTSATGIFIDNVKLNGPCNNKEEVNLAPDIQLYPNPATNNIQVEYELPQSTSANILVFDAFGKVVKNITDAELQAGHQTLNMDISDLAAGMYFYTLQANEWKATKKFIIIR